MLEEIFAWLDWVKVKMALPLRYRKSLFNEGEIWWCSVGWNVGVEIRGKEKKIHPPGFDCQKIQSTIVLRIAA